MIAWSALAAMLATAMVVFSFEVVVIVVLAAAAVVVHESS